MPQKFETKDKELKAGVFIILSVFLLLFVMAWLRYFSIEPEMIVIAKFKESRPLTSGLQAYYKGVSIGKIIKIEFSSDFQNTLVYIAIFKKNLKLPCNVSAKVRSSGIAGQKYLEIMKPNEPDTCLLTNNDTIEGVSGYGFDNIQDFLEKHIKNGNIERFITDLEETLVLQKKLTINLEESSGVFLDILHTTKKDIKTIIQDGAKSVNEFKKTMCHLNDVAGDIMVKKDIKETLSSSKKIAKNIEDVTGSKEIHNHLDETISNISLSSKKVKTVVDKADKSFERIDNLFNKTESILDHTQGIFTGSNISGNLICQTVSNINETAESFKCLNDNLSNMLSKRFLLFKLMFGRPGKGLKNCSKYSKKYSNEDNVKNASVIQNETDKDKKPKDCSNKVPESKKAE